MDWFLNEKNEIKELAATSNLHSLWYENIRAAAFELTGTIQVPGVFLFAA